MSEASKELQDYLRNDWSHELKVVRELLKGGADVNSVDEEGNSPLLLELRTSFDSSEMLEFLCKKGADLSHKNHRGQTALMLSVLRFSLDDFSARLIKEGVELDATDSDGNTAVHYAYGNKKILGLLIKAGASLDQINKKNQTVLHVPSGVYHSVGFDGRPYYGGIETATLKWLLKQGLDPNARDADGQTSLHAVSKIKSDEPQKAAQILIESGADPAVLDAMNTPLSVFHLHDGEQNLAKWFATKGSHPFDAIIAGDLEKVQKHFAPGVPLPILRWGLTPLHVAALIGASTEIVGQLIKATPDLDQPDENGNTALSLANSNKRSEMALALINAGASAAAQGSENSPEALKDVVLMANPELLSAMIKGKSGSELDQLVGPYTKHFRFNQHSLDCLKLLLESGMSPAAVDVSGLLEWNTYKDIEKSELGPVREIVLLLSRSIERGASHLLSVRAQQCLLKCMKAGIGEAAKDLLAACLARGMSSRWSNTESLLHKAVELRNVELIRSILAGNENLVYPSEPWRKTSMDLAVSPLRSAVKAGSCFSEGISLLLAAGPKVINDEILEEAIDHCRSEEVMAMLLDYKARSSGNLNDPTALLKTAADAAKRGMTDILESQIQRGVSLNSMSDGQPIFQILINQHTTIEKLEWAMNHGADLSLADNKGRTLLHHLAGHWGDLNEPVFKKLLSIGLDVNARDAAGYTPFHSGIGNQEKRRKLLEWGANPRVANQPGVTTLMLAVSNSDPECLRSLLDAGVSPLDRDTKGHTALAYIRNLDKEGKECIRLLINAGLHPDDSGDKKHLNDSLAADDIPFAIWLIEQQAQVSKCDLANKKVLAALSKIIRSRPELVSSQLFSLDAEQRSLLEPLLNKSINAPAEADRNELPQLLREDGWPIAVGSRSPLLASKVALPNVPARLVWTDGEQKQILSTRRIRPVPEADRKFEESIARFEKKPYELKIEVLLRAPDDLTAVRLN